MFYKVFGERLAAIEDKDQCVVRAVGMGIKDGKPKRIQLDIFEMQDGETGFTAMEKLTGFSASIYALAIAAGELEHGALRYEEAMSGTRFVEEIKRRGIALRLS